MVFLDASVWVSALFPNEHNHEAGLSWLNAWMSANLPISVPDLFAAEVASAVARRHRDPVSGLRTLADLRAEPTMDIIRLSQAAWRSAADFAAQYLIRGADAVYVALAEDLGVPLVTWDQELLNRASVAIDVRTPDQVPI